jgi:hypothetical protein
MTAERASRRLGCDAGALSKLSRKAAIVRALEVGVGDLMIFEELGPSFDGLIKQPAREALRI